MTRRGHLSPVPAIDAPLNTLAVPAPTMPAADPDTDCPVCQAPEGYHHAHWCDLRGVA
jgi:hypothetical protein